MNTLTGEVRNMSALEMQALNREAGRQVWVPLERYELGAPIPSFPHVDVPHVSRRDRRAAERAKGKRGRAR